MRPEKAELATGQRALLVGRCLKGALRGIVLRGRLGGFVRRGGLTLGAAVETDVDVGSEQGLGVLLQRLLHVGDSAVEVASNAKGHLSVCYAEDAPAINERRMATERPSSMN